MTTKILGKMIDLMLSSGRKENEIIDYIERMTRFSESNTVTHYGVLNYISGQEMKNKQTKSPLTGGLFI